MSTQHTPAPAPIPGDAPIQLYSLATPNGQKIGIILEELGLSYNAHKVNIGTDDQFTDWFKPINPNSKIPALVDRDGPGGKPISVFESAAIMIYLADKTGKLLPPLGNPARYEVIQWVFWQMSGLGPMFGQVGHFFVYAKESVPYAKQRYLNESLRLLRVLDHQLSTHEYIAGSEYTIADICSWTWVNAFLNNHKSREGIAEHIKEGTFPHVERWVALIRQRPAVERGLLVCK